MTSICYLNKTFFIEFTLFTHFWQLCYLNFLVVPSSSSLVLWKCFAPHCVFTTAERVKAEHSKSAFLKCEKVEHYGMNMRGGMRKCEKKKITRRRISHSDMLMNSIFRNVLFSAHQEENLLLTFRLFMGIIIHLHTTQYMYVIQTTPLTHFSIVSGVSI